MIFRYDRCDDRLAVRSQMIWQEPPTREGASPLHDCPSSAYTDSREESSEGNRGDEEK